VQRKHLRTGNGKHTDVTSTASPAVLATNVFNAEFLFFRNSGLYNVDIVVYQQPRRVKPGHSRDACSLHTIVKCSLHAVPSSHEAFDVKHFFVREKDMIIDGNIDIIQISTEHQVADVMTKPPARVRLIRMCDKMGLI